MSAVSSSTAAAKPPSQARGVPFYSALPIEMVERCLACLDATSVARTFTISKGLKSEYISQMVWRKLFEANFPMMFEKTLKECIAKNLFWETAVDWKSYLASCMKRNQTICTAKYERFQYQRSDIVHDLVYENGEFFTRTNGYAVMNIARRNKKNGSPEASISLCNLNEKLERKISNSSFYIAAISSSEEDDTASFVWKIVNLKTFTMTTFQAPNHQFALFNDDNTLYTYDQTTLQVWNVETCKLLNTIILKEPILNMHSACLVGNHLVYSGDGLTVVRLKDGAFIHQKSLKQLSNSDPLHWVSDLVSYGTMCFGRLCYKKNYETKFFYFNPTNGAFTVVQGWPADDFRLIHDILITYSLFENGLSAPQILYRHLATGKEIFREKIHAICGINFHLCRSTNGVALIDSTDIIFSPPNLLAQPPIPFTQKHATAVVDKKMDK